MLLLIPVITGALAAGAYLLARGSKGFASDWSRVVALVNGFVEFKTALRNVRTAGARRAGGAPLAYKAS
jgi:hypothetical protein